MAEISTGADSRSRTSLLLVVLAAVVPYLLLPPKPLIQDAGLAITGNKTVQEAPLAQVFVRDFWGGPAEADYGTRSYRPLVSLTYAVQARLFGGQPGLFHLVDMALHAGSAVLLALLLLELLPGSRWAPWGAALFAVHPAISEAVCSAFGRADLMAGASLLGALLLHLSAGRSRSPWLREAGALGLVAVGLLSKEYAVAFPFLLVVVDLCLRATGRIPVEDRPRGPWVWAGAFVLLAGYLGIRIALFGAVGDVPMVTGPDHPLVNTSLWVRWGTALWLFVPALRLLLLPTGLSYFYGYGTLPIASGLLDPRAVLGLVVIVALATLAVRLLVWSRDPVPAIALTLFVFPLAPSLNTVSIAGVLFAERFLYVPAAGLGMIAAWALGRTVAGERSRQVALGVCAAVLVVFCGLTMARVSVWRSSEALARASLKTYPEAAGPWFELGMALGRQGRQEEAAEAFARSAQLQDDRAMTWRYYALTLSALGRHADAAAAWRRAVALSPSDIGTLWAGLGGAELKAGHPEEAVRALTRARELMPKDDGVSVELSRALLFLAQQRLAAGRPDEAVSLAGRAAAQAPLPPEGLFLAGLVVSRAGEPERARPFFDRALEQDPDLLRKKHEVAVDLSRNGQYDKAAELLREILVVAPDHAPTLFELGAVLLKAGRSAEAVGYIEAGLDIQPNRSAETMLAEARRSATAPAPAPASSSTRMVQHAR